MGVTGSDLDGVVGVYPHTEALLERPLPLPGGRRLRLRPLSTVPGGAGAAFARQARQLPGFDFDIAELPVVNYLSSREHGARHTALPVFLTRRFVQDLLVVDREVVRDPRDLEGRRVGLLYHGHSDVTWLRGILAQQHGVDLSRVEWVTEAEEQVAAAPLPANIVHIPRTSVEEMLEAGELAARMTSPFRGAPGEGRIGPLWPDTEPVERAWYAATGIFPLLHTVVVRDDLLRAVPDLAGALYAAFSSARDDALATARGAGPPTDEQRARARASGLPLTPPDADRAFLPADPSPYGLEANRPALESLVRMARDLQVIETAPEVDELFAALG